MEVIKLSIKWVEQLTRGILFTIENRTIVIIVANLIISTMIRLNKTLNSGSPINFFVWHNLSRFFKELKSLGVEML